MRRAWSYLLLIALAAPLSAGVVYEIETTDHDASPPRVETTSVAAEGKNLKMEVAGGERGGKGDMIFHGGRREMIVVDHGKKSFTVIDDETFRSIGAMAGQMSAAMQEALKNVPPDQRAAVEEMMKRQMPQKAPARPRSEVRNTGERGEQAGYPCVKYEIYRGDQKTQELWVTDWSNIEGGRDAMAAFEDMADFFAEMMEAFSEASGGGLPGMETTVFEHMKQLDGFPVVTRDFDGGELESESLLRSASRRTLDPAEFEPPAGYKRQQMFQ